MVLRSGKFGEFYGCSTWPECNGTRNNVDDYKEPPKAKGPVMEEMDALLKANLSPESFKYWIDLRNNLPDIWDRPVSSTGKYHRRADGSMPTIAEHTYEMVYVGTKTLRIYGDTNTPETDALLVGLALHDSLKYGADGDRQHTTNNHDELIADRIKQERLAIPSTINDKVLEETVRYHAGRWASKTKGYDLESINLMIFFVHTLDMLSTADCLKVPEGGN
jgi:ssDNA-binding Zn-finger/Zn-ribbon topoisomerase 1